MSVSKTGSLAGNGGTPIAQTTPVEDFGPGPAEPSARKKSARGWSTGFPHHELGDEIGNRHIDVI